MSITSELAQEVRQELLLDRIEALEKRAEQLTVAIEGIVAALDTLSKLTRNMAKL